MKFICMAWFPLQSLASLDGQPEKEEACVTPGGVKSGKRQEARGKRQEARGKRQEARGKRQEARGKRQERREKQETSTCTGVSATMSVESQLPLPHT
jgi:uncharacterized protein YjbJ (UPF0337 family)